MDFVTFAILLGAFLLYQFIQNAAKRVRELQEQEERARQAQAEAAPGQEQPLEDVWGRSPAREESAPAPKPARRVEAVATRPAVAHRRPRTALFRTRQDLRHAVVVMTVLGPCRALEPYDRGREGSAVTAAQGRSGKR